MEKATDPTEQAYSTFFSVDITYIINYINKAIENLLIEYSLSNSPHLPLEASHKVLRSLYIKKGVWDRLKEAAETKGVSASQLAEQIIMRDICFDPQKQFHIFHNKLIELNEVLKICLVHYRNHEQFHKLEQLQAKINDFSRKIHNRAYELKHDL